MADILMFSANYLPNVGGVERFSFYICKELISAGHKVTLVTNNCFDLATEETVDGLKIFRFPCHNFINSRFPVAKKGKEFKRIDAILKAEHYDLIIINARFYTHSLYAAKLAKKRGIKAIVIEHGSSHLSLGNRLFDLAAAAVEHAITLLLKKYPADYYAVSGVAGEWSGHFGIKSKGTLYNAVDVEEIEEKLNNPVCSFREKLNIEKDVPIVAFTGRILKEKGLFELIEAANGIELDFRLVIAGVGPYENELMPLLNDKILYVGKLDFGEVIALLGESDIYCLPSYSEGMSTAVLEAVAARCFVITTAQGGAKELITDRDMGIIMPECKVELIKEALTEALNDRQYRISAAEKSYEALKKGFTFKATAKNIISIIKENK